MDEFDTRTSCIKLLQYEVAVWPEDSDLTFCSIYCETDAFIVCLEFYEIGKNSTPIIIRIDIVVIADIKFGFNRIQQSTRLKLINASGTLCNNF